MTFLTLALIVGCYGIVSAAAQLGSEPRSQFPSDPTKIFGQAKPGFTWTMSSPWFRPDLESDATLNETLRVLEPGRGGGGVSLESEQARSHLRQILSSAPYDAELWLALAVLEDHYDRGGPASVNALKMSYYTSPTALELMPVRLDTATLSDATTDADLAELVRGDLRLMLARRPDQKPAIVRAYRRASRHGKSFLEQAVGTIDPLSSHA
ncbi:hypothetical protein ACTGJ9_036435 [Bradyrhizobium sp. RDM12]